LQGPVIDFKYREELPKKILEEDLRKSAIIRVSQLTEVIKITSWFDDENIEKFEEVFKSLNQRFELDAPPKVSAEES